MDPNAAHVRVQMFTKCAVVFDASISIQDEDGQEKVTELIDYQVIHMKLKNICRVSTTMGRWSPNCHNNSFGIEKAIQPPQTTFC